MSLLIFESYSDPDPDRELLNRILSLWVKPPIYSATLDVLLGVLLILPFLPRDAMRINAVDVVARCPSVTFVYCIQTAEDIVKVFLGPVAPLF